MTGDTKTYRVVQWATGNIGTRSLRAVIEHPDMALAGVWVHSAEEEGLDALVIDEFADLSKRDSPALLFDLMGFGKDPATFGDARWAHGAASFGPSLCLVGDALGLPLDSVEARGEVAVARSTTDIAAGT